MIFSVPDQAVRLSALIGCGRFYKTSFRSSFDCHRDCVPAAQAQRDKPAPRVTPLHLVEQGDKYARAARADRMAERDRAAVYVQSLGIDAKLASDRHGLDRERLVQL